MINVSFQYFVCICVVCVTLVLILVVLLFRVFCKCRGSCYMLALFMGICFWLCSHCYFDLIMDHCNYCFISYSL
ncbi:hypothetical protein DsansV1_C03g0028911 [Dioscorea sansibarensis]